MAFIESCQAKRLEHSPWFPFHDLRCDLLTHTKHLVAMIRIRDEIDVRADHVDDRMVIGREAANASIRALHVHAMVGPTETVHSPRQTRAEINLKLGIEVLVRSAI